MLQDSGHKKSSSCQVPYGIVHVPPGEGGCGAETNLVPRTFSLFKIWGGGKKSWERGWAETYFLPL